MRRLTPLILAVLAVAGCGGAGTARPAGHAPSKVTSEVTVAAHGCSPADYTMQCALATQAAPPRLFALSPAVAHGWDFGWSCPYPAPAGEFGARPLVDFGASYLSADSSKNWTRSCVGEYHNLHVATVAVWETSANRALGGFAAGASDARSANAQARALGAPSNVHINFAIDFDASQGQQGAIDNYFRGADSVLGVNRVGDYGGYWPTIRLCAAHLVTRSWATYAWSGGRWPAASCAPLEQYQNGAHVDLDRAIAHDYGQWPYAAPKPTPRPQPVAVPHTFNQAFQLCFRRGFVVGADLRRHRVAPNFRARVPSRLRGACNLGFQPGFRDGFR